MALDNFGDSLRPLLSLADQKYSDVALKLAEKQGRLAPSPILPTAIEAEEAQQARTRLLSRESNPNLLDIAESSLYRGRENIFDLISGREQTGQEIQEFADFQAGVTPEARERLVGAPSEKVVQSLANDDYLGALGNAALAGPGVLADSANVVPEIVAGTALTALAGTGAPIIGRRIFKGAKAIGKVTERVKKAKKANLLKRAIASAPKTAGQMSVVTAGMTQSQINDFREEHGENPSKARTALMFGLNLSTMMVEGGILKSLFIPNFKKEIGKEIKTVVKNMGKGSNFVQLGKRIGTMSLKAIEAGGAEAAQEYFQTWAEIVNTKIGPKEAQNFFKAVSDQIGNKDNRLQALVGGFLGGGAGGTARVAISAPAVIAGGALDVTKATTKGVVKTAVGATKVVGRVTQKIANDASYKILSTKEREVLAKEYETRKAVVDEKVADIDRKINIVEKATTLSEMHTDEELTETVNKIQVDRQKTADALEDPKEFKALQDEVISRYKARSELLQDELTVSNVGRIAKKAGKNVIDKSVAAAKAVLKEVPVEELITATKKYGTQAVTAVKEIRSSTARGVLDLALREGTKATKTIMLAARDLELNDLERVTAVIVQKHPELAKPLNKLIKEKVKAQERFGQRNKDLITDKNLDDTVTAVAKAKTVARTQAASVKLVLTKTINSKIGDLKTLETVEAALEAYENSLVFKDQSVPGVLDPVSLKVLKDRLAKASNRIRKPISTEAKAKLSKVANEIKKKGVIEYFKESTVVKKTADILESETVKEFISKLKIQFPDLPDLSTEEDIEKFENAISKHFDDAVKTVDSVIRGEEKAEDRVKNKEEDAKLHQLLTLAAEALKGKGASDVLAAADGLITKLKNAGYETQEDLNDLIDDFPEFANNEEFYAKLQEAFPTPMVMSEEFDTVPDEAATDENIEKQYQEDNPGCSIK